jgi:transposase
LYNCPKVIKCPPQSPDLNENENFWAKLETEIRNHATSNKDDLKKALSEEWERIGPELKKKNQSGTIHSRLSKRSL